jgi:hypothetical protein
MTASVGATITKITQIATTSGLKTGVALTLAAGRFIVSKKKFEQLQRVCFRIHLFSMLTPLGYSIF